jgi:hypothetical protein
MIATGGDFGSAVAVDHAIHAEHVIVSYRDLIEEHRKIRRARCNVGQCSINECGIDWV